MEAVIPEVRPDDQDRSHGSVVTSLAELRALELERQAEERAAVEAAAAARHREREVAIQVARDAVATRIAAERAAELAAEQARADAEREARLQVDKAEAAERARRLIALEEHRMAEELALQREVALRQRPRWLVVVTALAIGATAGLGWFALDCRRRATAAVQTRDRALAAVVRAEGDTRDARATIDHRDHEIAALEAALEAANRRADEARREAELRAGQPPHRGSEPAGRAHPLDTVHPPATVHPPTGPLRIPADCLVNPLCDPRAGDPHARRN